MLRIIERDDKSNFPMNFWPVNGNTDDTHWQWFYGRITFEGLRPAHQEGTHGGLAAQFAMQARTIGVKKETDLRNLEIGIEITFGNRNTFVWFEEYLLKGTLPKMFVDLEELLVLGPEMSILELAATAVRLSTTLHISYNPTDQRVTFQLTGAYNSSVEVPRAEVELFFAFDKTEE